MAACCRFLWGSTDKSSDNKGPPSQSSSAQARAEEIDDKNVPNDGSPYVMKTARRIQPKKADVKEFYDIGEEVASGAYSRIRRGFIKGTQDEVALKYISKETTTEEERETILDEVQILRSIRHPNVVAFYEFFEDKDFWIVVMEIASGGELFERLKDSPNKVVDEDIARSVIKTVLTTLALLHQHGIVWRDAKPENLLFKDPESWEDVQLIDFGFAKKLSVNERMDAFVGTPEYAAPEVVALIDVNRKGKSSPPIKGRTGKITRLPGQAYYEVTFDDDPDEVQIVEPRQIEVTSQTYEDRDRAPKDLRDLQLDDRVIVFKWPSYNTKSDIWSIGVVLYVMLCGYPPFVGETHRKLFSKIKQGKVEFSDESWANKSKAVKRFLRSMLTVNPSQRPTASQLLENDWIQGREAPPTPVPEASPPANLDEGGVELAAVDD